MGEVTDREIALVLLASELKEPLDALVERRCDHDPLWTCWATFPDRLNKWCGPCVAEVALAGIAIRAGFEVPSNYSDDGLRPTPSRTHLGMKS